MAFIHIGVYYHNIILEHLCYPAKLLTITPHAHSSFLGNDLSIQIFVF